MGTPQSRMKQRLDDLLKTVKRNRGVSIVLLRNKFAFEHGVRPLTVTGYCTLLARAGLIHEKDGRLYPVEEAEAAGPT